MSSSDGWFGGSPWKLVDQVKERLKEAEKQVDASLGIAAQEEHGSVPYSGQQGSSSVWEHGPATAPRTPDVAPAAAAATATGRTPSPDPYPASNSSASPNVRSVRDVKSTTPVSAFKKSRLGSSSKLGARKVFRGSPPSKRVEPKGPDPSTTLEMNMDMEVQERSPQKTNNNASVEGKSESVMDTPSGPSTDATDPELPPNALGDGRTSASPEPHTQTPGGLDTIAEGGSSNKPDTNDAHVPHDATEPPEISDGLAVGVTSDDAAQSDERKSGAVVPATPEETVHSDDQEQHGLAALSVESLQEEMAKLSEALHEREQQLERQQAEAANLCDINEALKRELSNAQGVAAGKEFESMKEEFSQRIGDLDRRMAEVGKERDDARTKVRELEKVHAKEVADLQKRLDDQLVQLASYRDEGEALSRKQLTLESIIKKLRSESDDLTAQNEMQKKKLVSSEDSDRTLKEKLNAAESSLKEFTAKAASAKDETAVSSRQLGERNRDLAVMEARVDELQAQLDQSKAAIVAERLHAAQSIEESSSRLEAESREQIDALQHTVTDLRAALSKNQREFAKREESLRKEVEEVRIQHSEAERRNEELSSAVPAATRPLLRQIEALQASISARTVAWDNTERSLTVRTTKAEAAHLLVEEQLSDVKAQLSVKDGKVAALQDALTNAKQAGSQQTSRIQELERRMAQLEQTSAESIRTAERDNLNKSTKLEAQNAKLQEQVSQLADKHRCVQDDLNAAQAQVLKLEASAKQRPANTSPVVRTKAPSPPPKSPVLSLASNSGVANTHLLAATLRMREGELEGLQKRLSMLEKERETMEDELVAMTQRLKQSSSSEAQIGELQHRLMQTELSYQHALELAGEKTEELEELKHDLVDIKAIYREQTNELVQRIQQLESRDGTHPSPTSRPISKKSL